MSTEKTFDKADLLRFFHETEGDALVGKVTVIHPPTPQQLAFDREAETGETIRYPVLAETTALYCERYGFAVVIQSAVFPDGGAQYLPVGHWLREAAKEPRNTIRRGGTSSQLSRWAADLADAFRAEVRFWLPTEAIDRTQRRAPDADRSATGTTIDDVLAQHGGAGADESAGGADGADESEGA